MAVIPVANPTNAVRTHLVIVMPKNTVEVFAKQVLQWSEEAALSMRDLVAEILNVFIMRSKSKDSKAG